MKRHVAVVVIAMVSGCHKHAGSEYFGKHVAPPGILAKVQLGMTVDELKAAIPGAAEDDGHGYLLAKPASNIKLYAVAVDNVVVEPYVDYAGSDAVAVLTAAWGPPDPEPDREHHDQPAWRNATTGWRSTVFCGHGTDKEPLPPFCTISFYPHKPLEAMFGKAVAPPDDRAKLAIGMPLDAARAATKRPLAAINARDSEYDGAVENINFVDGKLFELSYSLPALALPMIEKAWGPGTKSGDTTFWYDPQSGWCAKLRQSDQGLWLHFNGYMPFDKEIDLLDSMTAAKDYDDAKRMHPELAWTDNHERHEIELPYNELIQPDNFVAGHMTVDVSGATHLSFVTLMLDPTKADTIIASFTKRWGAPKTNTRSTRDKDLTSTTYHWAGHVTMERVANASSLFLTIAAD